MAVATGRKESSLSEEFQSGWIEVIAVCGHVRIPGSLQNEVLMNSYSKAVFSSCCGKGLSKWLIDESNRFVTVLGAENSMTKAKADGTRLRDLTFVEDLVPRWLFPHYDVTRQKGQERSGLTRALISFRSSSSLLNTL